MKLGFLQVILLLSVLFLLPASKVKDCQPFDVRIDQVAALKDITFSTIGECSQSFLIILTKKGEESVACITRNGQMNQTQNSEDQRWDHYCFLDLDDQVAKEMQYNAFGWTGVAQDYSVPLREEYLAFEALIRESVDQKKKLSTERKGKPLWVDCDPGLDDTLALITASRNPSLHLMGVSTTAGNSNIRSTTRNALDILYNCDRSEVPVVQGAGIATKGESRGAEYIHGEDGLGGVKIPRSPIDPIQGIDFETEIFNRIRQFGDKITWVNLGPLTNLCLVLRAHPEIIDHISEIVLMGGAIGVGNVSPAAQFNMFFDAHAADCVFKEKGEIPLRMIPLDVTSNVRAVDYVYEKLQKREQPLAKAMHEMLKQYQKNELKYSGGEETHPSVHDPTVPYYLVHPEEFTMKKVRVEIDTYPASIGRTNCVFYDSDGKAVESIDSIAVRMHSVERFWDFNFKAFQEVFAFDFQ